MDGRRVPVGRRGGGRDLAVALSRAGHDDCQGNLARRRRALSVRNDVLRIAVPNKGELSDPAITLLTEAGYRQRRDSRDLILVDQRNDVEFFYLRPRDVAVYVGLGTVDAGITGRDLLLATGAEAIEHRE